MSETPFTRLLNAWEASAHTPRPAKHGYSEKRQAVLKYVADLERELAAATAELAATRCPIGLDGHHEICSAGTCHKCFAEHLAAATTEINALQQAIEKMRYCNRHYGNGPHCTCSQRERDDIAKAVLSSEEPRT